MIVRNKEKKILLKQLLSTFLPGSYLKLKICFRWMNNVKESTNGPKYRAPPGDLRWKMILDGSCTRVRPRKFGLHITKLCVDLVPLLFHYEFLKCQTYVQYDIKEAY